MKNLIAIATAALITTGAAGVAQADDHMETKTATAEKAMKAEVVETNARGQATKVKIGANMYDVCMNEAQDDCINPRAAGLKWGNRPLSYWPGKPASQM